MLPMENSPMEACMRTISSCVAHYLIANLVITKSRDRKTLIETLDVVIVEISG